MTWRPHIIKIRRNFLRRSLRDTQPKIRVPKIRFFRFMISTIFFWALLDVPSLKETVFRVRVIKAKWIWPIFTLRTRRNFFTETKIKSPGYAYFRLKPPIVWIHSTKRAPELSIVFSQVCTWIINSLNYISFVKLFSWFKNKAQAAIVCDAFANGASI